MEETNNTVQEAMPEPAIPPDEMPAHAPQVITTNNTQALGIAQAMRDLDQTLHNVQGYQPEPSYQPEMEKHEPAKVDNLAEVRVLLSPSVYDLLIAAPLNAAVRVMCQQETHVPIPPELKSTQEIAAHIINTRKSPEWKAQQADGIVRARPVRTTTEFRYRVWESGSESGICNYERNYGQSLHVHLSADELVEIAEECDDSDEFHDRVRQHCEDRMHDNADMEYEDESTNGHVVRDSDVSDSGLDVRVRDLMEDLRTAAAAVYGEGDDRIQELMSNLGY